MWTFAVWMRSKTASLILVPSASRQQRGRQAVSRRGLALAVSCIAAFEIVTYLALKLGSADGAPLWCFFARGAAAVRACDVTIASDWSAEVRAEAHYNRGIELDHLDRYAEAVLAYDRAVQLEPDYAAAYTNMGVTLAKLGRWEDALHAYHAAIRKQPQYADAHYNLGVTLAELRRWGEALEAFREAVRVNPKDAEALYNMGLMLNHLGRHEEALTAYGSAVRIHPSNANAWGNLGMTAHLLRRDSQAVSAFERARMLVPTYFDRRNAQRKALEESRQRWQSPEPR
jgi:tetratricopeptide (TPR) repeat protein